MVESQGVRIAFILCAFIFPTMLNGIDRLRVARANLYVAARPVIYQKTVPIRNRQVVSLINFVI